MLNPALAKLAGAATALSVLLGAAGCTASHEGPASPHFDGTHFFNPGHDKRSSPLGYLWLRLTDPPADWAAVAPPAAAPRPAERVGGGGAAVTYVGHATLLIQVGGLNILTDPMWSDRASAVSWLGPRRVVPPALALEALPPIDLVLISHDHYDHLDLPTLRRLDARDRPRVLVPLGNRALVADTMPASQVSEHDWGARVAVGTAAIHFEPMLHGAGRSPFDQMERLWSAYVIDADGLRIFHVGDAGYGDGSTFRAAAGKHDGFDLVILPIGAYAPESFMVDSHMDPAQAVRAFVDARAQRAMAHHFDTFQLGFEAFGAAPAALQGALQAQGVDASRFTVPALGQTLRLQR
jgi:L-ascorbate metabolism protein UlaG (beta-lactamase superfamily)